jgi:zinc protease
MARLRRGAAAVLFPHAREVSAVTAINRTWARTLATVGAVALVAAPMPAQTPGASQASISVPFDKYTLPNGLTVVLAEDHSTPTVAVEVLYHVGSKNEEVGHTGFAHLFEHVMFTGSGHVPYGLHDKYTEGVGGGNNGNTTNDFTQYYETIPSNYLQDALWLESDRMGWLLDALDTAKYNAQRDIVKNEKRQSYDNQPYGRVTEIFANAVYPKGHPYSWPVIGSMADLSAASVEDVKAFFRLYYAPNNAVLAIVGDFDPAQAKAWIDRYFSGIPRGRPVTRPNAAPVMLAAERRLMYEDRVQVPRLFIEWPTIGSNSPDQYALDILADILAGSRTARLTKSLVYDRQIATNVFSGQDTHEIVGEFEIAVTPRPGHSLAELESATDSVLARIRSEGPTTEELERSKAGLQLSFLEGLESNLGKAVRLAVGQAYRNDPASEFGGAYRRYELTTAADIQRVAQRYLTVGRVVLSVVPMGKTDMASKPESSTLVPPTSVATPPSGGDNR